MVRDALCSLIREEPALVDNARSCESILRDRCPGAGADLQVILYAHKDGVPIKLRNAGRGATLEMEFSRLSQNLIDKHGMREAAAKWAVEAWALALGLVKMATVKWDSTKEAAVDPAEVIRAERQFRMAVRQALLDRVITDEEQRILLDYQDTLAIPQAKAKQILLEEKLAKESAPRSTAVSPGQAVVTSSAGNREQYDRLTIAQEYLDTGEMRSAQAILNEMAVPSAESGLRDWYKEIAQNCANVRRERDLAHQQLQASVSTLNLEPGSAQSALFYVQIGCLSVAVVGLALTFLGWFLSESTAWEWGLFFLVPGGALATFFNWLRKGI